MSKALEAAAAGISRVRLWDGDMCGGFLSDAEKREIATAAITAFLDAAAGDEAVTDRCANAALDENDLRRGNHAIGKASILALKESVNG